jgi:hypothetical protein
LEDDVSVFFDTHTAPMLTVAIVVSALCLCEDVHPAEERVVVDPTPQHTNLSLLVAGLTIRLSSRHAKVRRGGYRKSIESVRDALHAGDPVKLAVKADQRACGSEKVPGSIQEPAVGDAAPMRLPDGRSTAPPAPVAPPARG